MSGGGSGSLVGMMNPFDESAESLSIFLERLEHFFFANDVQEEKRTATLLSLIGPKYYSSLRDSSAPALPSHKTYSELVEMLKAPVPMEMSERFIFYQRNQKPRETVAEYVSALKHLARFCNFESFLDEALRDRLVCGVNDAAVQKRLLSERILTLDSAVAIGSAMETENMSMRQGGLAGVKGARRGGMRVTTREKLCFICGEPGHIKQDCQHKSVVCDRCGRGGHVTTMCRVPYNMITRRNNNRGRTMTGMASGHIRGQGDDAAQLECRDQDGRNGENLAGRRGMGSQYNSRQRQLQQPRGRVSQDYDYFLVLDFEATCDEMKTINPQEVIEFPVLKVDAKTFSVEGTFHHFVRPTKHPVLSQFCTRLTTITQEEVNQGLVFDQVFVEFDQWVKEEVGLEKRFLFVTCGDWDLKTMLPKQCISSNLQVPSYCKQWLNIKKSYAVMTGEYNKGMMPMIHGLSLTHQGTLHRGLDDCHNIANILKELAERGCKFLPTMSVE